jgi:hypothetical protein
MKEQVIRSEELEEENVVPQEGFDPSTFLG